MISSFKKALPIFIMAIVIILLFAYFVYPGRYKFIDKVPYFYKIDRLNGEVFKLDPETSEWKKY